MVLCIFCFGHFCFNRVFFGAILKTQVCKNLPAIIRNVASSMRVKRLNAKHGVDTMQAQNPDSIMMQFPFPLEVRTAKCCKYRANERSKFQDVAHSPTPKTVEKRNPFWTKQCKSKTGKPLHRIETGQPHFETLPQNYTLRNRKHTFQDRIPRSICICETILPEKNMHPRVGKHRKENDFCKWQNMHSSQDTIARPCKNTCRTLM